MEKSNKEQTMTITKDEAHILCDFIEYDIFEKIRNDTEIDNMNWLVCVADLFKRMAVFSGYDGATYTICKQEEDDD